MKNSLLIITIILIVFIVTSCAVHEATFNSYVDPNIANEPMTSIAIFPIKNVRLALYESQQINRKISQAIHQRDPNIKLMSSNTVIDILNEYDLADDWAIFLDNYISSGIPDENFLREVGDVLNVDCILQGKIVDIFQRDGAFGLEKHSAYSLQGETRATVRITILSTRSGKLLWEASTDGVRATSTTLGDAPPVIEAVNLAVDRILQDLPI
ncbi:MAG: hypothetical protein V3V72_11990 [Ignavibacteriaceae bacterium]